MAILACFCSCLLLVCDINYQLFSLSCSSHHESLKALKAINEVRFPISNVFMCCISDSLIFFESQQLFVKYNIHFSGVSRAVFRASDNHTDGSDFADLVSQIISMSFDSTGLHWRYISIVCYILSI